MSYKSIYGQDLMTIHPSMLIKSISSRYLELPGCAHQCLPDVQPLIADTDYVHFNSLDSQHYLCKEDTYNCTLGTTDSKTTLLETRGLAMGHLLGLVGCTQSSVTSLGCSWAGCSE
jgi:hypothetical protein